MLDIPDSIQDRGCNQRIETYYIQNASQRSPTRVLRDVIGAFILLPKSVTIDGVAYKAIYGDTLSVDTAYAGHRLGQRLLEESLAQSMQHDDDQQMVYYSQIESSNIRSYTSFLRAGYEPLTTFHTLTYSRTWPKWHQRVERLPYIERLEIIQRLNALYHDVILTDFVHSVQCHQYHIIRDEQGEIVAGVQASMHHWYLEHMPGLGGWLTLNVLPWLPLIGRQVQRDMHFLKLGNLYMAPGHTHDLEALISHVLNAHQVCTGMVYMHKLSPMYDVLVNGIGLGLVHSLTGPTEVKYMVHTTRTSDKLCAMIASRPVHLNMMD